MKSVFEQSVKQAVAAIATLLVAGSVFAQNYPSKPVTLLVPYPAGGLSDVIARTVNNTLSKNLGQPVIVDNLGGASGAIAAQKVLSAPSDGQIIFQGSPNELILAPLAISAVKFKSEDFRLVQMIATAQIGGFANGRNSDVNFLTWLGKARQLCRDHDSGHVFDVNLASTGGCFKVRQRAFQAHTQTVEQGLHALCGK